MICVAALGHLQALSREERSGSYCFVYYSDHRLNPLVNMISLIPSSTAWHYRGQLSRDLETKTSLAAWRLLTNFVAFVIGGE